jgi:hypothetical protein
MHALFVYGERRCRKPGVGERPDRNCDVFLMSPELIVDSGTAS